MAYGEVILTEFDQSLQPPSPSSLAAAIIVAARKGPVGVPTLVTSGTSYLETFAVDNTIAIDDDIAHYSALDLLRGTNKLWVIRVADSPFYAGCFLGVAVADHVAFDATTSMQADTNIAPASWEFNQFVAILAKNQGVWGNKISVQVLASTVTGLMANPNLVTLNVYYDGEFKESHKVTRLMGEKDGYGRSTYGPNVLERDSEYVQMIVNPTPESALGTSIADTTPIAASTPGTRTNLLAGADGAVVPDASYTTELAKFDDRELYPFSLFMDGGKTVPAYATSIITQCTSRRSYGLLSTPLGTDSLTEMMTFRNTVLNADTRFAGVYGPWTKVADSFNSRELLVPPIGPVAWLKANGARLRGVHYPAAGNINGRLPQVIDVEHRFNATDIAAIQDLGINIIRYREGRGIVVWGNHTLYRADSALDSEHISLMLNEVQVAVHTLCENYIFTLNDDVTRAALYGIVFSYLNNKHGERAFTRFNLKCDIENNPPAQRAQGRLHIWWSVFPTYAVEEVVFRTIVTQDDVTTTSSA